MYNKYSNMVIPYRNHQKSRINVILIMKVWMAVSLRKEMQPGLACPKRKVAK